MSVIVQVAGKAIIEVDTGTADALEPLGYTENGVEITEQPFVLDVHGDENGGDAGPPIDIQQLGEVHVIRMTFTKYDEAVMNKVRARAKGSSAGTPVAAGTLLFQGDKTYRLLINSAYTPRNYTRVVFREPNEVNKGTKHSKAVLVATAYKDDNGLLYDTTGASTTTSS